MVNKLWIVIILFALPSLGNAISPDDLRKITSENDRAEKKKRARLSVEDRARLFTPVKPYNDNTVTIIKRNENVRKPVSKYNKESDASYAPRVNYSNNSTVGGNSDSSFKPSVQQIKFDTPSRKGRKYFGITIGTWSKARLNRNTTNVEPGLIELTLTDAVHGKRKTLDAGTLFFAKKSLNNGTKRLELLIVKGITPDGKEFKVRGLIFDTNKVSGLRGIIDTDENMIAQNSLNTGLLAFGGAAAKEVSKVNPIGSALGDGLGSVITDSRKAAKAGQVDIVTIYVSPQDLFIRFDESF